MGISDAIFLELHLCPLRFHLIGVHGYSQMVCIEILQTGPNH